MRHPRGATTPSEPLTAALRELKDRTGLSLAALAARTPYSKSAWHRYLSGAQRPPRPAVEALCRLAGADPAAVLARWDACAAKPPADPPEAPGPNRPAGRRGRFPLPALALCGAAAALAATFALSGHPGPVPTAQPLSGAPRCHGRSCQGQLPEVSACVRDAQTRSTASDPAYAVRLRYSPACGTVWSEVRIHTPRPREVSVRAGQDVLSATYPADDSTGYSSPMLPVSSPRGVEACAEVDGKLACTGLDVEPDSPR
ncbi:XRE family transcriptional regulator [Streptomyces sp. NPDC051452]|uniref:XRE family transcriptional regulator n=1 Tax=Streptomyces sp. NPDC051452 TaxID=3365654 RepID=UPI0037ACE3FF